MRTWSEEHPRPLIYCAAPYAQGNLVTNVRYVVSMAEKIVEMEGIPLIPHVNILWDLVAPHMHDWWCNYELYLLSPCDALYRGKGESPGGDREVRIALQLGQPVFHDEPESDLLMFEWITDWIESNDDEAYNDPAFRGQRAICLADSGILG